MDTNDSGSQAGAWFRLAWALVGAFAIVRGVETLQPSLEMLPLMWVLRLETEPLHWIILEALAAPALLFASGFLLIRYCDSLASRFGGAAAENVPDWEPRAYRLAFTACGVLALSWALPKLGQVASNLAFGLVGRTEYDSMRRSGWILAVWMAVQCAAGTYLLLGAPHIVKWQVRRGEG